ncbi:hypothetical protein QUF70_20900, partial [Desulfobacterales bacterium HSG17]|nr:hypothetical protein [Desulfobacterales bacterium HSG17]
WSVILAVLFIIKFQVNADCAEFADLEIHGFISQGYLSSNENNYQADTKQGSFQFNEMGINFGKNLTDNLRIGLQIFSRDLGNTGNNEVEIDWAYGDYRWQDWLGLRVGLVKMSEGIYNETRDIDMLRTFVLLPQGVYNETLRDSITRMWGTEIYGEIPLNSIGNFSYRILIGTYTPDADNSGLTKFIEDASPFAMEYLDYDNGIQYNGSLQWHSPVDGLRIGITAWKQNNLTLDFKNTQPLGPEIPANVTWELDMEYSSRVFSAEYTWENLIFSAEYQYRENSAIVHELGIEEIFNSEAYYAGISYRFSGLFEMGTYYSVSYPDKDDKNGDRFIQIGQPDFRAWQKDFALCARFDFNEYWLLKLEGHVINGVGDLFLMSNPEGFEENWYLFAAKVTFDF